MDSILIPFQFWADAGHPSGTTKHPVVNPPNSVTIHLLKNVRETGLVDISNCKVHRRCALSPLSGNPSPWHWRLTVSFQPTSDLIFHYFPTRIPHQSPAGLSPISGTYHALHSCASGYCFTFQSSLLSQAYRSQFYSTLRPVLYTLLYDSFLILSKGFDLLLFEFLLNHVHTSSC